MERERERDGKEKKYKIIKTRKRKIKKSNVTFIGKQRGYKEK